jgi:hypothetical protein
VVEVVEKEVESFKIFREWIFKKITVSSPKCSQPLNQENLTCKLLCCYHISSNS